MLLSAFVPVTGQESPLTRAPAYGVGTKGENTIPELGMSREELEMV